MSKAIIDLIYEASLEPDRWCEVLDRITQSVEASAGFIWAYQNNDMQYYCTDSMLKMTERGISLGWDKAEHNVRATKGKKTQGAIQFRRDIDYLDQEVIDNSPLYTDFLNPEGWGPGAATLIALPNQKQVAIGFENRLHAGPLGECALDKLNALAPHLEAAVRLSSRMGGIRATSMTSAMEAMGIAACAVTEDCSVIAINEPFTKLGAHVFVGAFDKLIISDAVAQKHISIILQQFASGQIRPQSVPARKEGGDAVTMLNAFPMLGDMRDIFTRTVALLVATPNKRRLPQAPEAIANFYGLTRTEARTALELASGLSTNEIATRHDVSVGTARNHVKSALSKTGSRRQSDLVRLINNILPF